MPHFIDFQLHCALLPLDMMAKSSPTKHRLVVVHVRSTKYCLLSIIRPLKMVFKILWLPLPRCFLQFFFHGKERSYKGASSIIHSSWRVNKLGVSIQGMNRGCQKVMGQCHCERPQRLCGGKNKDMSTNGGSQTVMSENEGAESDTGLLGAGGDSHI